MLYLGVDVGGTFTDIILADTDKSDFAVHKLLSTSPDPSEGVIQGVRTLCEREGVELSRVDHHFHGTTVATNAVLEHDGARTGMITTKGYRDIVHIGRHQRPQNYSILQDIPWQARPFVRRRHRKVVTERLIPPRGDVLSPLDEDEARREIRALREEAVESIAVCFLFSYLNDEHETRVRRLIEEEYPGVFVTTSADITPQFREFERFTTACLNAFVGPKLRRFIDALSSRLHEAGAEKEPHVMLSNGGIATARTVAEKPVYTLLSGPAAGVLGGAWTARLAGRENVITFDVGGTSADIGIVTRSGIAEASARDTAIAGYPVMVPMIDVHTIGAGGGSIAYVDEGGAFRVGPKSAGSMPGPACYGRGGDAPTVTDANIVLGRLDKDHFLGGAMSVRPELSFEAMTKLAGRLGFDLYETAEGINTIVASNMANAIRSRTVQKGHDPRKFSLVAFGGAGPLNAVEVARHLKIPEVIVPMYPGITSALGLLTTDLKYDFLRTEFMISGELDVEKLVRDIEELEQTARERLHDDGVADDDVELQRSFDLRYLGQGYEIRVPFSESMKETLSKNAVENLWEDFHERHRREYGHHFPSNPIEIVNLRVAGVGLMPPLPQPSYEGGLGSLADAKLESGASYYRKDAKLVELASDFYERSRIPVGAVIEGPAVIFQSDSTTVLPPESSATVDPSGNLIIETGA